MGLPGLLCMMVCVLCSGMLKWVGRKGIRSGLWVYSREILSELWGGGDMVIGSGVVLGFGLDMWEHRGSPGVHTLVVVMLGASSRFYAVG